MSRFLLSLIALALLSLVACGQAQAAAESKSAQAGQKKAEAPTRKAKKSAKAGQKKTKRAKAKRAKAKRAKAKRAKAKRAKAKRAKTKRAKAKRAKAKRKRRAKRRRRPNLPEGWAWPPTKAMISQGERCHKDLTKLGLNWKKAKRRRNIATPVIIRSMNFGGLKVEPKFRKPPFVMDCHLAKSLAEAGPALVAIGVRALRFSSIHSYRKVRTGGRTKSMLSRHAYGLAVDIYEVDPSEGERLIVRDDYVVAEEGDIDIPDRGAKLLLQLESESNASGQFRLLLTPANDPKSHYDHFHFEARVGSLDGKKARRKAKKAGKRAGKRKQGKSAGKGRQGKKRKRVTSAPAAQ